MSRCLIIALCALLGGCVSKSTTEIPGEGVERITTAGSPIWERETIWKGIQVVGFFRESLIYTGVEGSTAFFDYREIGRGEMAPVPAYGQSLRYDLQSSRDFSFREIRIRVHEAMPSEIRYEVLPRQQVIQGDD